MPKIIEEKGYDGAESRIKRLGLQPLLGEVRAIATDFSLLVKEEKDANGGAAVRELIDARFIKAAGWTKTQSGGVDWIKCQVVNGTSVCLGVEVQFSARSDLLVMDVIHLRKAISDGRIDVGVLMVPSDRLGRFLTDRGPKFSDATRHVHESRSEDLPIIVMAVEHDGPGEALAKRAKT
jgi:hypothetical protein